MRAAVIGAGFAGLAAARTLARNGVETVVFEKSRGLGGRAAVKRAGPYVFDSGAGTVAPRGLALEDAIAELALPDAEIVERPIYKHSQGRISPGDAGRSVGRRYAFQNGITSLAKGLAKGLDVRLESRVETIERPPDGGWCLEGECFDYVILTPPAPQASALLETAREPRPIASAVYRQTISVMLGFEEPFDAPWHALIDPEQDEPLTWLSVETLKTSRGRAPEGCTAIVCQMNRAYSRSRWEAEDTAVIKEVLVDVQRLMGAAFSRPKEAALHRWRYAQPEATVSPEAANPPGTTLLLAGDALEGSRVELAYQSGLRAAERVLLGAGDRY